MNVKLIMNWDIKPGRDQEYFEFLVREWIPGPTGLGLKHSGAWVTTYSRGDTPQIMTEGIAKDFRAMRTILESDDWEQLHDQLLEYVSNYEQKIVRVTGTFQI
jgi:hypothetical protein